MNIPTKNQLLQELDSIGHPGRVQRMALLGRDAAGTKALNNLLDELLSGDTYQQMLCLFASVAARDGPRILTLLQSESTLLRNYTAPTCWAVTDDEALAAVVLKAAPDTRKRLIRAIAKQRRTVLAERLFPEIRAKVGADLAVLLLSACTPATVEKALAEDSHAIKHWQRLAGRYPDIVLRLLQQTFEAAPQRTYQSLWQHFDSAWKPLTLLRPEKVLELVQAFTVVPSKSSSRYYWFRRAFNTDWLGIPSQVLEILIKRLPDGVFNLLTQAQYHEKLQNNGLPTSVLNHFRLFSSKQQITLLQQLVKNPSSVAEALAQLPPSVRAERFTAAYANVDTQHTVWPETLLDTLPHADRAKLAQHQLTLREIREEPQRQLAMTAYDDIDNARPLLEKAATSAQAEERGQALALLVRCTARYRRGLTETLTFLQRLKNEQDPVRSAAWTALANEVPPSLFKAEHVELLQQLVNFSMEARDTSPATRYAIEELAFTLLCANATEPKSQLFTAALEILRQLAQQSGSLQLPSLSNKLPLGTEYAIVEALIPLIRAFEQREQYSLLLRLVESLGKRGRYIAKLQEALEMVVNAKPDYLAERAIDLWLAPFKTRDARVRKLLDKDSSVIRIDRVFQHLHRHRQEWLDPFLTKKTIKGQFLTGKTPYLLPAQSGFQRWLPRQQQTFTKWLHIVANDEKHDDQHQVQAIHTLARIPTSNTATFESYLNSEEVVINEAALGALSWIDHPQTALPILLQYLEGDRARVAMYAVPRCARLVEPEKLVLVLQQLLSRDKLRVTVHKEAIRLLGTHATPASLPLLHEQWQRPSVHRDVQIAIGHAARHLLSHEEAWKLVEKLAKTEDVDIARSLFAQQPTALPQTARVRYAKLLLNMTTHSDVRVRNEVFTTLKEWTVGAEEEIAAAAVTSIINLKDSPEWRDAWKVLLTCCRDGLAAERLYEVVQSLINAPVTASNNATPERDLPARQRLFFLCQGLCKLPESNRLLLRPTLDKLASLYLQDASLWVQATWLYIAGLPWATPAKCADRLMQLAQEASTQPIFVQPLCKTVRENLQRCKTPIEMTATLELIDTLTSQSDISALLALEILRYMGSRSHWEEACAKRLRYLRQHNNIGVRAIACKIWTNEE
jgi:hypothetical protein